MIKTFQRLVFAFLFIFSQFGSAVALSYAQPIATNLSQAKILHTTSTFNPTILDGIILHPENSLKIDFIVDLGDDAKYGDALKNEASQLIEYFFASLTIPNQDLWVNLSPYEKNRIIAPGLGKTLMGKDMLSQDYLLKQLASSLIYPEEPIGQRFWDNVKQQVQKQFGDIEIPTQTFNKIWIIPESADIYMNGNHIFVADSRLKVMLEEDYLALQNHSGIRTETKSSPITGQLKDALKQIIIPEIEKEVNHGRLFAKLRQIYHSLILANWYKQHLKSSLINQAYSNQNKTLGIQINNPKHDLQYIYNQYVKTFQEGVFNYTKEEYDPKTEEMIPHKYFSGGLALQEVGKNTQNIPKLKAGSSLLAREKNPKIVVTIDSQLTTSSPTTTDDTNPPSEEEIARRYENVVEEMAQTILQKFPNGNAIISIDGQSASGKSVFANLLLKRLQTLLPQEQISLFGLDAYLKDYNFRHALEKWIINAPMNEFEQNIIPDQIKKDVVRGGEYTHEQDLFDNAAIAEKLTQALRFFTGSETTGNISVHQPYNHLHPIASQTPLDIPLKRGGILIVEGKYANLPQLQPYSSLKVRVADINDAIRHRYEQRTRRRDPNKVEAQLKFFDQALVPSFDKYIRETNDQIDYRIDIGNPDYENWQVVKNTPASTPISDEKYGGVDFNPRHIQMKTSVQDLDIKFTNPLSMQPDSVIGIIPVIQTITPLPNLQLLLSPRTVTN